MMVSSLASSFWASIMVEFRVSILGSRWSLTLAQIFAHIEKSKGFKSGELGGQKLSRVLHLLDLPKMVRGIFGLGS